MFTDYYGVLGIASDATPRDIKSAFRKKAKHLHPDLSGFPGRIKSKVEESPGESMRLLLEAYSILSDPRKRREYDRGRLRIVNSAPGAEFDYRVWLKERLDEPEYVAKLIFYDLLHGLEDEALQLYDRNRSRDDGRLERFFERPEAMDAEFCIAEEYARRGRFVDAYQVMVKLIRMEQKSPGFGYFYEVVLGRFRKLVLDELSRVLEPDAFLALLVEACSLHCSAETDAQFLRKAADLFLKRGSIQEAAAALTRATALKPRMPGLKAMRAKLELHSGS
jgi:tetratricopeptide (TPR) repeat protein